MTALAILRAGTPYARSPVGGVRHVYLRKVAAHLYYTFRSNGLVKFRVALSARAETTEALRPHSIPGPLAVRPTKGNCQFAMAFQIEHDRKPA
jgi:hypothetical protein